MNVDYGNTVHISTIDWHGKVSITLFFATCPFSCPYCQNYEILSSYNTIDVAELKNSIDKSKPFVNSVVFSGGEPLMQLDALKELALYSKEIGLTIGIQSCGYYLKNTEKIIEEGLVNKFFIDIKAPPTDIRTFGKVIGISDEAHLKKIIFNLREIINLIIDNGIELELRTTIVPSFFGSVKKITEIAKWIAFNFNKDVPFVIQQGIPKHAFNKSMRNGEPFSRNEIFAFSMHARKYLTNVGIRTKEFGNEIVE